MMKKLLVLALITLIGTPTAVLSDDAENYIQYRQAIMKAIGGHMGATSQLLRGRVSPQGDHLAMHTSALAALNSDLTQLFPEGSDFGETEAKGEIWDQWDQFEKAANETKAATAKLAEAVAGGDRSEITSAHRAVGRTCKGCHEDFREKND